MMFIIVISEENVTVIYVLVPDAKNLDIESIFHSDFLKPPQEYYGISKPYKKEILPDLKPQQQGRSQYKRDFQEWGNSYMNIKGGNDRTTIDAMPFSGFSSYKKDYQKINIQKTEPEGSNYKRTGCQNLIPFQGLTTNIEEEIRANLIGEGFQQTPILRKNWTRINIIGEIMQAYDFDIENLYIEYEFVLQDNWKPDYEDLQMISKKPSEETKREWNMLNSITQAASPTIQKYTQNGKQIVTNYCFPFDIQLQTSSETITECKKFPFMFLILHSLDSWGRKRLEGYGFCEVPNKPGTHEIIVKTWTPCQSLYAKIHEFFLGGQTKLYDIKKLHKQNVFSAIDRFNIKTDSRGSVKVRFNIGFQSKKYRDEQRSLQEAKRMNQRLEMERLDDLDQIQKRIQSYQNNFQYPVIKNSYTTSLRYKNQQLNKEYV
ncbi:hypothetical protein IMG5_108820 [Ichthyophthirius multifiliis]|uniref:Meckel syndrome type 1 protein n=1 Tax=Ichthyophthirius multifiliis TaxID=5932 RepID=G0QTI4_ICHMU|nr:hypothetical protein IMG5_108820 [Ichthyophthirius multifiliis]EGR31469.1 hypothetical protein IMG5_108820 [Ichthyophthirius multifiliis]|eukprot:XP_004034955.1 hypothetical protein IMG5_108820 [Ichthyophthirius multifiliis]